MRTLLLCLALLSLSGCGPKTTSASASTSTSALTGSPGWWLPPDLAQIPLHQLARLRFDSENWQKTARRAGLEPDDFDKTSWGSTTVMVMDSGDYKQHLAIYLTHSTSSESQGLIVRGKSPAGRGDVVSQLTELAASADHGGTWNLHEGAGYTLLVSQQQPIVEVGCRVEPPPALCHAVVYHSSLTYEGHGQLSKNSDFAFTRAVKVR